MNNHVKIFEVGPRDGLQNEKRLIKTADKIKLVDMLTDCGCSHIETSSFVSPKWVPQMADAAEVFAGISKRTSTVYSALTPNLRGFEAAAAAGADEVAVFGSASEGFSQKNINCSIDESISRFTDVVEAALSKKYNVRGYVSCVTDCPYDGPTHPDKVVQVALKLLELGCYEISLGDTIGAATPETTDLLISAMLNYMSPDVLAGHFHDTSGRALENIGVCLEHGIRTFDSSVGGLGGCPYAGGATGNVDTVAVVTMLEDLQFETGIDLGKLKKTAEFAKSLIEG